MNDLERKLKKVEGERDKLRKANNDFKEVMKLFFEECDKGDNALATELVIKMKELLKESE